MRTKSNEDVTSKSQNLWIFGDLKILEALAAVRYGKVTEHWSAILIGQGGMVSAFWEFDAEGIYGKLLAKKKVMLPTIG